MKNIIYSIPLAFVIISCSNQTSGEVESKKELPLTLIYLSSRGDGFDLYQKKIGDSTETKITSNPGWDWNAQAINGEGIVHNSTDTLDGFSMRKIEANGNSASLYLGGLPEVTIAPDGDQVVYARKNGDNNYLMLSKLSSLKDSILISDEESYNGRAKWSAKSNKIAYISDRTGSNEIFVYSVNGKSTLQLTSNGYREKYLSWGPDGEFIATTMQTDSTENDIYQISILTKTVDQLTNTPEIHESEISWSPNGQFIAYHAKVNTKDDIYLLNIETKEVKKVTNGEGYHGEPVFILP